MRAMNWSSRSGRVGRLELRDDRQELLGTLELVDDLQHVDALVVLADRQVADHLDHVEGDPLLDRQPIG